MTEITPSQIYTMAHKRVPKTKKAEAFELVCDLIEGRIELTPERLAVLYSFFLPAPKKAKGPASWVALAVAGKKDVRYYLRYVYSDGKRLMATDGRRLHIWEQTLAPVEFPAGYYDTALKPVDEEAKYPDIDRILGGFPGVETREYQISDLNVVQVNRKGAEFDGYDLEPQERYGVINCWYLQQVVNGEDTFKVLSHKPNGAYKFAGPFEGCYSVIMPMRRD